MVDRLAGITAKIERAEKHIDDFSAEWIAFGRGAYEVRADKDLDETGRRVFRFRVKHDIPPRLSTMIGDAVGNMRTALDYIIFQLLAAQGITAGRHHYFPISSSADQFESTYGGKVRGVGDESERLLRALKPYKGGTDGYWILDELTRTDKHRLLLTTVIRPDALAINLADEFADLYAQMFADVAPIPERQGPPDELKGRFLLIRGNNNPCPVLKDGDEIYSEPGEGNSHKHTQLGFAIAFGQGEVLECEAVTPSLRQLLDLVKGTVEPFRPLLS